MAPNPRRPKMARFEPRDSLFHWCGTVDAIQQTNKQSDKRALLDAYFEAVAEETIAPAARFFAGTFLVAQNGKPGRIDWTVVAEAIQDLARMSARDLRARCTTSGDLGVVAADAFAGRLPSGASVADVAAWGDEVSAAVGAPAEGTLVREMLARLSSLEARYLVNLITGELHIGVDAAEVEAAAATRLSGPDARHSVDRRKENVPRSGPDQPQRRRRRAS